MGRWPHHAMAFHNIFYLYLSYTWRMYIRLRHGPPRKERPYRLGVSAYIYNIVTVQPVADLQSPVWGLCDAVSFFRLPRRLVPELLRLALFAKKISFSSMHLKGLDHCTSTYKY